MLIHRKFPLCIVRYDGLPPLETEMANVLGDPVVAGPTAVSVTVHVAPATAVPAATVTVAGVGEVPEHARCGLLLARPAMPARPSSEATQNGRAGSQCGFGRPLRLALGWSLWGPF